MVFSGIPQRPNPPSIRVIPSLIPSMASCAFFTLLSIILRSDFSANKIKDFFGILLALQPLFGKFNRKKSAEVSNIRLETAKSYKSGWIYVFYCITFCPGAEIILFLQPVNQPLTKDVNVA